MWNEPVQQLHIWLVKLMVKHATLFHCFFYYYYYFLLALQHCSSKNVAHISEPEKLNAPIFYWSVSCKLHAWFGYLKKVWIFIPSAGNQSTCTLSDPFKAGVFCYSLKIVMLVATLHSWQLYRTITWKLPCTFWISLRTIKVFNWTVFFLLITCICSIVIILLFTSHLMMESRGPQNVLL